MILQHFGLRRIQSSLYVGKIENDERETLVKNVEKIIRKKDSFLIVPLCRNCFSKKECCGRELKFKDDLYRVY